MLEGGNAVAAAPVPKAGHRPTTRSLVCVVGLALLAAGLTVWTSRDGAPTTADSAVYIGTAQNVAAGHGLNVPFHYYPLGNVSIGTPPPGQSAPRSTPLVIYAPLAPLLLAVGGHPYGAARVEDALFFALTILMVGVFVLDVTEELWLAAAAQIVIAFSLATMASDVGTLAPALFFSAGGLIALLRYRERQRPTWLILAALLIGLATLERYASGGLIIWGAMVLRHRRRDVLAFLAMSGAPLTAWFLYEQASGRSTGHFVGIHIVASTIKSGVRSIADWVLPANTPLPIALLGAIAVVVAVALLLRKSITTRLLVLFIVVQVVILEVAITFFDAGVNLEPVEFIPMFFAVVVAVACALAPTRWMKVLAAAAALACVVRFGVDTTTHSTYGYATPAWVHSPVMADVRALPAGAVIYSNAPDAIYLLVHRATSSVPETVDFSTLKANPHFGAQLGEIRRTLAARQGFVVYVRGLGRDAFLPTEAVLEHDLGLRPVHEARDGAVYVIPRAGG